MKVQRQKKKKYCEPPIKEKKEQKQKNNNKVISRRASLAGPCTEETNKEAGKWKHVVALNKQTFENNTHRDY